jgi:C-terminal processing protease CtpA/Prc
VAELFAYDLRAFNPNKVYLVGEPTKGMNTVQEPFPLTAVGGAAMLTVGTVVPYGVSVKDSGTWNQGGVQPGAATAEETERLLGEGVIFSIKGADNQRNTALRNLYELAQPKGGA